MKRGVLFRFHKEFEVCRNRVEILRKLNPTMLIYPMYGGSKENLDPAKSFCREAGLEPFYEVKSDDLIWKWKNGDLQIQQWFKAVGRNLTFDFLHLIEWDLSLLENLENLYGRFSEGVVLTGLRPLKDVRDRWSWLVEEPYRSEWFKLMDLVKEKYEYDQEPYACLFPGCSFSRRFLEKLQTIEIPELDNDEVRIPLWTQILGESLHDTGFYPGWFSEKIYRYFNCRGREIEETVIRQKLARIGGQRVFHPFYKEFRISQKETPSGLLIRNFFPAVLILTKGRTR